MNILKRYPNIKPGESLLSRSVVVENLIFPSSMVGINLDSGEVSSDRIEEQVTTSMHNLEAALKEAGSSLDNLVKIYVFLRDMTECSRMWSAMLEYCQKHASTLVKEPPAFTISEVVALAKPEYKVEIDAIAVISKQKPGWEMKKYPMYRSGIKQVYPNIKPGMAFVSESVVVGNMVFLSAMDGANPDTGKIETGVFEEQWQIALEKVRAAMDRAGSSLSNVIKTLHFQCKTESLLVGAQDVSHAHSPSSDRLWKTELLYYEEHAPFLLEEFPASTFLKVPALPDPNSKGQTDVIGVVSKFKPGWEIKNYPTYIGRRGFTRHIGDIKKYYANSVRVGNIIIVSGQTPVDNYTAKIETDDFKEQALASLSNLKEALEETGSSLDNLIKTHILIPDPQNLPVFRKVELEFFQKYAPGLVQEPPASSVIHPLNLASPKLYIEIEAIAYLQR